MTCTQSASAQAQCSVSFTNSVDYDNGFNPRVAYAGKNVVKVHNAGEGVGPLWYHVGQLSKPFSGIKWAAATNTKSGQNPAVALS
jgi:hypothetical protein